MIALLEFQFTCGLLVKLKTDTNYLGRLEGPKHSHSTHNSRSLSRPSWQTMSQSHKISGKQYPTHLQRNNETS